MPIRFAAARPALRHSLAPRARARLIGGAANDNHVAVQGHDPLLRDALKHFAQHGLRAAQVARDNALEAHRLGDAAESAHWLEICRALDRRMAMALAARIAPAQ